MTKDSNGRSVHHGHVGIENECDRKLPDDAKTWTDSEALALGFRGPSAWIQRPSAWICVICLVLHNIWIAVEGEARHGPVSG